MYLRRICVARYVAAIRHKYVDNTSEYVTIRVSRENPTNCEGKPPPTLEIDRVCVTVEAGRP